MRFPRTGGLAAVLLATAGIAALSCAGEDTPVADNASPETTTSSAAPSPPSSTVSASTVPVPSTPTKTPPASTPASTADVTVEVSIAGGKVSAGGHAVVKAEPGQQVRINGVSDVADSLHVHGYDKTLELKPGMPASVEFTATTKGIFEVETHESGKLVFKLQVS